jgi:hypothetical protein
MKNTKRENLLNILSTVKGTSAVSFNTTTSVKMNKTNNPYHGRVTKVSKVNGIVGFNYKNSCNNQLEREGKEKNFKPQSRKWGKHDEKIPCVINHTNKNGEFKQYVNLKVQSTSDKPKYFLDDEPINKEVIKDFLPQSKKPNTQKNIDDEIVVRDYDVDSIDGMSIKKMKIEF